MSLGLLLCLFLQGAPQAWAQPVPVTYSIWATPLPANPSWDDPKGIEVGLKFRSAVNAYITGIRYYKGPLNAGTHIGNLWKSTGELLRSVTFDSETPSGWQQQALPAPVPISANTTYIVSYYAPAGDYAVDLAYFATSGVDNYPLRALANNEDGANGVYAYNASSTFPDSPSPGHNYWVDVVMEDHTPPTIVCPPDVIMQCADCNTDPSNTGTATATDDSSGPVTIGSPSDAISGVCPKVVKRTWTATDWAGNAASCVQTITCLPPSLVTDGSGAIFDRDPITPVQDFRLLFIQDPRNWPSYKLAASNPGQFFYNVFYVGTPGFEVTFNVTLPYPFVTQGANPIHAYDWVTVTGVGAQQSLVPGNALFVSSQQVTPSDYAVTLTVPPSGVVYLTIHLDYGLKSTSGYMTDSSADAIDAATGTKMLIPNNGTYTFSHTFSVVGAVSAPASVSIQNNNSFKRIPGVAGLVQNSFGDGVSRVAATLQNATHQPVVSVNTDEDGFYMIPYKATGKAATYFVSIVTPSGYPDSKTTTLKANAFVLLDPFLVP